MGFGVGGADPGTFDWDDAWQGAMTGLMQGVASIGLNYVTEQLDFNPLLSNLAYSVIATGVEGIFEQKSLFKHISDSFTQAAGKMIGYNPPPNVYDQKFWDYDSVANKSMFNSQRYQSALNSYEQNQHWQDAASMANTINFSKIIQERGLEEAMNTYATSLFNGIAVNAITNTVNISITNIGSYIKEKLDKYKINPESAPEISKETMENGETKYVLRMKDEITKKLAIEILLDEKIGSDTQEKYITFNGYSIPKLSTISGDEWWGDPESFRAGLGKGVVEELFGSHEIKYDIFFNEDGTIAQGPVTIIDLNSGNTTIIRPESAVIDSDGYFYDAYIEQGLTINNVFDMEKRYYVLDGNVISKEEKGVFTYYDTIDTVTKIEENVAFTTKYDREVAYENFLAAAERYFSRMESGQFVDSGGNIVKIVKSEDGMISYLINGKQVYSDTPNGWAQLMEISRIPFPDNIILPEKGANLEDMKESIISQLGIENPQDHDLIKSIDDMKDILSQTHNIGDSDLTGIQILKNYTFDNYVNISLLKGFNAESEAFFFLKYGNQGADQRFTIEVDPGYEVAISRVKEGEIKKGVNANFS